MLLRQQFVRFFTAAIWVTTLSASGQTDKSPPPALPMIEVTNRHPVIRPRPLSPLPAASALKFVQYEGGRLSITADGATLKEVLDAVGSVTGANIEFPGDTVTDRVAVRLGPAPAGDVLRSLFLGSKYDYLILGSPDQPGTIKTLVVRLRSASVPPEDSAAIVSGAAPGASSPSFPVPDALPLGHDLYEQYRLPDGRSPAEVGMSRSDFLQRFEALEKMRKLYEQEQQKPQ